MPTGLEDVNDPYHLLRLLFRNPHIDEDFEEEPNEEANSNTRIAPARIAPARIENKSKFWKIVLVISLLIAVISLAYYVLTELL